MSIQSEDNGEKAVIRSRTMPELSLPIYFDPIATEFGNVKIPAGNFPAGFYGCEGLTLTQLSLIMQEIIKQKLLDRQQKTNQGGIGNNSGAGDGSGGNSGVGDNGGDNGGNNGGGGGTTPLLVTYDSFYQRMNITGQSGLVIETKDPEGNVLGSGTIPPSKSLTYAINEGMLLGGTVITTKATNGSGATYTHNLVSSFITECYEPNAYPVIELFSSLGYSYLKENTDPDVPFPETVTGQMIVEFSTGQTLEVNLADYVGERYIDVFVNGVNTESFETPSKPSNLSVKVKVRFKNLNQRVLVIPYNCDKHYKFFDDGVTDLGYQLAINWDTATTYTVKKVPDYLPSSTTGLDQMFSQGNNNGVTFEDVTVLDPIETWNTANVTSTVKTFSGLPFEVLPISNWDLTSLIYSGEMFSGSSLNMPISFVTPNLRVTISMLHGCQYFNSPFSLTMDEVVDTTSMFQQCFLFNQPLLFNMPKLKKANYMFAQCSKFNQNIMWYTHLLEEIEGFLLDATDFNGLLTGLIVDNIKNMYRTFMNCSNLNTSFSHFRTDFCTDMRYMINGCSVFNQDLSWMCVPLIPTLPVGFSIGSPLTLAQQPVWGTCPTPQT